MRPGAGAGRVGSLSSSSNTSREVENEELLHHLQRRYRVIKPFMGRPPEMSNDDGELQRVTGPSEPPPPPAPPAAKKKRSLPGTPDPSAEVIALSPKTLMATNRFVCEICHKGFQRDQNLQLHRRGHNLPWKLRQRSGGPARKRVYVCPEASCVHHNPARALGDLTGIKKHYCRKHGEKRWKCERCAKRYAVQSDWKAHAKVCGTRQYKCDCGTVFSRRDSFVTHRAFCDALAQENNKLAQPMNMTTVASALQGQAAHHLALPPPSSLDAAAAGLHNAEDDVFGMDTKSPQLRMLPVSDDANNPPPLGMAGRMLSSLAARSVASPPAFSFTSFGGTLGLDGPPPGTGFSSSAGSASMSATALLQRAASMRATTSSASMVYGSAAGFHGSGGFGPALISLPTTSAFGPVTRDGQTQLVGFDYGGGSMTRAIGSLLHGGPDHQRQDDKRVVDYMGVGPFGSHVGLWM